MDWAQLFIGLAVLVGFGLLKILAGLVWEGLKTRLRRELESDRTPPAAESARGSEERPASDRSARSNRVKDGTAFAGHPRAGGGR